MNKEEARRTAVKLLQNVFQDNVKALASIMCAEADGDWDAIREALDNLGRFADKLRDNVV